MRCKSLLALAGLSALVFFPMGESYGQRGGRGGGVRAGGAGGSVVGPYGGGGGGARSTSNVIGPAGGRSTVGAGGGSYTTGRGTTIDYAGAGRKTTGPGGVTAGRGVGGVQVTGPGGQTATKVGTVGGVQGPGGYGAVKGGSVAGTTGPRGTAGSISHAGAAVGPGGAVAGGGRVSAGTGAAGNSFRSASGWGAAANPYGAYLNAGRVTTVNHHTTYYNSTALRSQGVVVRRGFVYYNSFTPTWYTAHPAAWRAAAWTTATIWAWATYPTVATFCGYPAQPVVYNYGSNIVYEDNRVYYNGEPVATAEEYADQAGQIAATGHAAKPSDKEEWQSLGVFAMVQGDETDANSLFQIALNKDGVIRGNYYNGLTDTTVPISGSVDKKTQRAAWIVGDKKETVYETGVGNLAEPETTMLVHFGKERTQQWKLMRLEKPADEK
jgi:hypothetical protein